MALRSGPALLSGPSTLQGHSDFPQLLTPALPVSSNLACAYRRRITAEAGGSQVRFPVRSPRMPLTLPRVPCRCICLFFPAGIGLPLNSTGSACSPALAEFVPHSGSPSYMRPVRYHEAASFVFVLRPAGLAGTPDWVRGTVSGQVPPRCYHPNAPPAYISLKATGMAGSFHPASKRFRNLIHVTRSG